MTSGGGVIILKASDGGVIRERFSGRLKNSKTHSGGLFMNCSLFNEYIFI